MKSIVLIAAGVIALFSGCASVPDQPASAYDNIDVQRVNAVNHAASGRGVMVLWVRYPEARRAPADVVPSLGEPTGT